MQNPPLKVTALIAAIAAIVLSVIGLVVELFGLSSVIAGITLVAGTPGANAMFWVNTALAVVMSLIGLLLCLGGGTAAVLAFVKRTTKPLLVVAALNAVYILLGDLLLAGGMNLYAIYNMVSMEVPTALIATTVSGVVVALLMSLVMLVVWIVIAAFSVKGNQVIDED